VFSGSQSLDHSVEDSPTFCSPNQVLHAV